MDTTLLVTTALSGGLLWSAGYVAPFALKPLAKKDQFLTLIQAGDGVRINAGGDFYDFQISLPGSHLNRKGTSYFDSDYPEWEILSNGDIPDVFFDHRPKWMREFGYYFIGIPGQRSVHWEQFEWMEFKHGVTPEGLPITRERSESTKVFKVNSFPYAMVESEIFTKNGYQVKVYFVTPLRITNPKIALIDTEDWMVAVAAAIGQQVKNFIGKFDFEELVSLSDETDAGKQIRENFSIDLLALNTRLFGEAGVPDPKGLKGEYGVTLGAPDLKKVVPDGKKSQDYLDLLFERTTAKVKGDVTRLNADNTAYETEKVRTAGAKMTQLELESQAAGEKARYAAAQETAEGAALVLGNEAIGKAGTVIVPASLDKILGKLGDKLK